MLCGGNNYKHIFCHAFAYFIFTFIFLIFHFGSRRWSREHKAGVGSPVFGYMATTGNTVKTPNVGGPPYQVSIEDRMRWAQIADVMAQANHYAVSIPAIKHIIITLNCSIVLIIL